MLASFWHSPKNIDTYFYISLAGFNRQQVAARTDRRFGSKAVVNGNCGDGIRFSTRPLRKSRKKHPPQPFSYPRFKCSEKLTALEFGHFPMTAERSLEFGHFLAPKA